MGVAFPKVFDTKDEVEAYRKSLQQVPESTVIRWLALISSITGIDLSIYDIDQSLPEHVQTNGSRGTLDWLRRGKATPRQMALRMARLTETEPLVGTVDQVADEMGETMEFVGGDGFLIAGALTPRYVNRIVDKLIPALQKRGLVRSSYSHALFRENLLAY